MKKISTVSFIKLLFFPLLLCAAPLFLSGFTAAAASIAHGHSSQNTEDFTPENVFNAPLKAIISPNEGHLENRAEVQIMDLDGQRAVSFIVPAHASNLQLEIPGQTISRWISEPVALKSTSRHSTTRSRLINERDNLNAQISTLQARLDLWKMQTPSSVPQDLTERQNLMEQAMPGLAQSLQQLKSRLKVVEEELGEMPAAGEVGRKITAYLIGEPAKEHSARLIYSYNLPSCGWNAIYEFNARPDGDKGDIVEVRLLAEVWQYTGMDWSNTEITLATRGSGPREPYPLAEWIIGDKPRPQPRAVLMSNKAKAAQPEASVTANLDVAPPPVAHVTGNADSLYASWDLSVKGLPEGKSRLQILSDAWQAPLQWLARPVHGDNRVWLYAKYMLPAHQGWPDGLAQYSVDNQNVGDGYFTPKGGEATLYFGADPRVQIRTTVDSSKQGETGIINTNKTWTWAWTYTLTNMHNAPVKVKVERPAPIIQHEDVQVSYNDKPESIKDDKEHMVYWNITVPANGKTQIEHSVTVTAPVKLELLPDVP